MLYDCSTDGLDRYHLLTGAVEKGAPGVTDLHCVWYHVLFRGQSCTGSIRWNIVRLWDGGYINAGDYTDICLIFAYSFVVLIPYVPVCNDYKRY